MCLLRRRVWSSGGALARAVPVLLLLLPPLLARGQSAALESDAPTTVSPREHAGYVMKDGTVQIITYSGMADTVKALNRLFVAKHPGVRFSVLTGDNYSVMATLTFDRTAFAPLGTEYTRIGLGDNLKIAAEPAGFRIAHASTKPGMGVPMLAVVVNRANPVETLSLAQITSIFAVGAPNGDLANWGQAGVKNNLAERAIHPFGPMASDYLDSEDPQAGEFLSTDKMSGLNMNHSYVGLPRYADIVQQVGEDPAAIGIVPLREVTPAVKVIGVKRTSTSPPSMGSASDIAAGRYPLDRFVYIYLRAGKGAPLDAFGKEYLRMALSAEGQRVIAEGADGYIPLNQAEAAEERAKLDR